MNWKVQCRCVFRAAEMIAIDVIISYVSTGFFFEESEKPSDAPHLLGNNIPITNVLIAKIHLLKKPN